MYNSDSIVGSESDWVGVSPDAVAVYASRTQTCSGMINWNTKRVAFLRTFSLNVHMGKWLWVYPSSYVHWSKPIEHVTLNKLTVRIRCHCNMYVHVCVRAWDHRVLTWVKCILSSLGLNFRDNVCVCVCVCIRRTVLQSLVVVQMWMALRPRQSRKEMRWVRDILELEISLVRQES